MCGIPHAAVRPPQMPNTTSATEFPDQFLTILQWNPQTASYNIWQVISSEILLTVRIKDNGIPDDATLIITAQLVREMWVSIQLLSIKRHIVVHRTR